MESRKDKKGKARKSVGESTKAKKPKLDDKETAESSQGKTSRETEAKERKTRSSKKAQLSIETAISRVGLTTNEIKKARTTVGRVGKASQGYLVQTDMAVRSFSEAVREYNNLMKSHDKARIEYAVPMVGYVRAVQVYGGEDNFPRAIFNNWNEYVNDNFDDMGYHQDQLSVMKSMRLVMVKQLRSAAGHLGLHLPGGILMPDSHVYGSFEVKERERKRGHRHNNAGQKNKSGEIKGDANDDVMEQEEDDNANIAASTGADTISDQPINDQPTDQQMVDYEPIAVNQTTLQTEANEVYDTSCKNEFGNETNGEHEEMPVEDSKENDVGECSHSFLQTHETGQNKDDQVSNERENEQEDTHTNHTNKSNDGECDRDDGSVSTGSEEYVSCDEHQQTI
ncbi:hypothetical protein F4861DRAFT_540575 [Xylaria intraflava]|nr:hypothetical protein F4861DRAFT_540575 [Xylaria intraflava]